MADQSIGMMEGAFFVSKGEILSWVNHLLQLNLQKIEQLGTGAAYCQIVDVMYPGRVKMQRVNWKAKNEWEFIVNFKILQQAFEKCNIKKHIDIERLSKAKYQDNLEFAQWFKRFFEQNPLKSQEMYDPAQVRQKNQESGQADFSFVEFRENPRVKQIQKEKSQEDSADARLNSKKLISRSKSPIIKNHFQNSVNKNKDSLTKENRQQIQLLQKFLEIESIVNSLMDENQKIIKIKEICCETREAGVLNQDSNQQIKNSYNQLLQNISQNLNQNQNNNQSANQSFSNSNNNKKHSINLSNILQNNDNNSNVILEEESPKFSNQNKIHNNNELPLKEIKEIKANRQTSNDKLNQDNTQAINNNNSQVNTNTKVQNQSQTSKQNQNNHETTKKHPVKNIKHQAHQQQQQ